MDRTLRLRTALALTVVACMCGAAVLLVLRRSTTCPQNAERACAGAVAHVQAAIAVLALSLCAQHGRLRSDSALARRTVSTCLLAAAVALLLAAQLWLGAAGDQAEAGPGGVVVWGLLMAWVASLMASASNWFTAAVSRPGPLAPTPLLGDVRVMAAPSRKFVDVDQRGARAPMYLRAEGQPQTGGGGLQYNPDKFKDPNMANYGQLDEKLAKQEAERAAAEKAAYEKENMMKLEKEEMERRIRVFESIPEDFEVGRPEDFMYGAGIQEELALLDKQMVGLKSVKDRVNEIASLLVVDKMRRKMGLETGCPSLHMCFTGAPGTGKTTVAIRMGQILAKMGYVEDGHVIVATRDDLVGQYVGHTAPKTKDVIEKAQGGVLLIDEAYYLYNAENDRDYGQESIEILLQSMEDPEIDVVVIFAGYKDRMDRFFSYIPGLNSRVGNHIEFPDYGPEEMAQIAEVMADENEYLLAPGALDKFQEYINIRKNYPYFSNARTVRNAMERAQMFSAIRNFKKGIQNTGDTPLRDIISLTDDDFEQLIAELTSKEGDAIVA